MSTVLLVLLMLQWVGWQATWQSACCSGVGSRLLRCSLQGCCCCCAHSWQAYAAVCMVCSQASSGHYLEQL